MLPHARISVVECDISLASSKTKEVWLQGAIFQLFLLWREVCKKCLWKLTEKSICNMWTCYIFRDFKLIALLESKFHLLIFSLPKSLSERELPSLWISEISEIRSIRLPSTELPKNSRYFYRICIWFDFLYNILRTHPTSLSLKWSSWKKA